MQPFRFLPAVVVLAAACGSTSFEVDFGGGTGTVEEAGVYLIEDEIAPQLGESLVGECPDVADPAVGTTFTCTGTTERGEVITFAGVVDREDHIDLNSDNLIVAARVSEWAATAASSVARTVGFEVTVDCGDRFVVLDDEAGMTCEVTDPDGVSTDLRISNVDLDAGTFDWTIDAG